jgi:hypothetical protein
MMKCFTEKCLRHSADKGEEKWQNRFVTESMPVISVSWQAIKRWRRLRNSPEIRSSSVLTVAGLLIPKRISAIPCPSSNDRRGPV